MYQWEVDTAVMQDRRRPCLYGVYGPCYHPRCLDAHAVTIRGTINERRSQQVSAVQSYVHTTPTGVEAERGTARTGKKV